MFFIIQLHVSIPYSNHHHTVAYTRIKGKHVHKIQYFFYETPHLQSFVFIYVGNLMYYLLIIKDLVIKNFRRPNSTLKLYSLTPWSRVLLEKLTGSQLVRKLWHPKFHYRIYKCPHTKIIISLNKNFQYG
jgi:hypothetical protein